VLVDVPAFQRVLAAEWQVTFAPLETSHQIVLSGERYAAVRDSSAPLLLRLGRDYREWIPIFSAANSLAEGVLDADRASSVLFDVLAVYLAYDEELVGIEEFRALLDDGGILVRSPEGRPVRVALTWTDFDAFLDHVVERILAAASRS